MLRGIARRQTEKAQSNATSAKEGLPKKDKEFAVVSMVLAIIVGALVGAAGFIPVFKIATRARKMLATNNVGSLGLLLLSLFISALAMLVAIALCANFARDVLLPFVLALAVGLSATAIVYGVRSNKKK